MSPHKKRDPRGRRSAMLRKRGAWGGYGGTDLVFGQLRVVLQHAHDLHVLAGAAHQDPVLVDALKLRQTGTLSAQ